MDIGEKHDAFVSHASEDKKTVVRPLVNELLKLGFKLWYDEFSLKLGDSLFKSINEGLAKSNFGIIILSPSFLEKKWPQEELGALFAQEVVRKENLLIPVWHEVDSITLSKQYPILADRIAARTSDGIEIIARQIANAMGSPRADTLEAAWEMGMKCLSLMKDLAPNIVNNATDAVRILDDDIGWESTYKATVAMTFANNDYARLKILYEQTYKFTLPYRDVESIQMLLAPVLQVFGEVSAAFNSSMAMVIQAQEKSKITPPEKTGKFVPYDQLSFHSSEGT